MGRRYRHDVAIGYDPCRWVGGDYVDVVRLHDGRIMLATPIDRVLTALNHEEPDRVPRDLGGRVSSMMAEAYEAVREQPGPARARALWGVIWPE